MSNSTPATPAAPSDSAVRGMTPIHPFRPLFFGAAAFASLGMILWGLFLHLGWLPMSALPAPLWHGHAMLFGFASALIGGFLLTAAANWTRMVTTTPASLATLFTLWLAARIVFMTTLPLALAAALELAYLLGLALLVGRVVVRAGSRRNFFVIGLLLSYAALDAAFLFGAAYGTALASHALVWTVDWITLLMLAIGGRVIPLFTGRRLSNLKVTDRKPLMLAVNLGALLALLIDIADAPAALRGALWLLLGVLALLRLAGWRGWGTLHEPMLWSLHLGYLWLAIGMALRGATLLGLWVQLPGLNNSLHGITIGALGTLSLAMMTRVAQGHSGVAIRANRWLVAAFLLPSGAALLRLSGRPELWPAAACLWVLAYLIYLGTVGPLLLRGRVLSAPDA